MFYVIIILFFWGINVANANISGDSLAKINIISQVENLKAAEKFFVAIEIEPVEGWHTYWRNPGDAGLATQVDFSMPEGFSIIDTLWQTPSIFSFEGMANYGFDKKHYIFFQIQVPNILIENEYAFEATVKWLVCKDICLPGKDNISLHLQKNDYIEYNEIFKEIFTDVAISYNDEIQTFVDEESILLPLTNLPIRDNLLFIPYEEGIINNGSKQSIELIDGAEYLRIELDKFRAGVPSKLFGILKNKEIAYEVLLII